MTYDTPRLPDAEETVTMDSPTPDAEMGTSPGAQSRPILVAVDFSSDSAAALRWALDQADILGAPVHIVHVLHDPAEAPGKYMANKQGPMRPMADAANEMMNDFLADVRHDCPQSHSLDEAKTTLVAGLPVPAILNLARRLTARLVVVGTRGNRGLKRIILGSIAERIVQNSPIPVTVIKAESS